MSQLYFARRIFIFSSNHLIKWIIPFVTVLLTAAQMAGTIAYTAIGLSGSQKSLLHLAEPAIQKIAIALFACDAAADLGLALVMCFLLYNSRGEVQK